VLFLYVAYKRNKIQLFCIEYVKAKNIVNNFYYPQSLYYVNYLSFKT